MKLDLQFRAFFITMKRIILLASLLPLLFQAQGQKRFEFTDSARDALDKVMHLQFGEAEFLISDIKTNDPENLIVYHIENYIDFFKVYISEDYKSFVKLEKNKNARIEKFKQGDRRSPYYLYLQANIRLHWALARLKFEEYFTSFLEVNKAFKLLEENVKKFPDFVPNKKDLGILHAMVGTIPDNYKWGVEMLSSLNGTLDQGKAEIELVMDYSSKHDFVYEKETIVLYAYLLLHLDNNSAKAWSILQSDNLNPKTNPLACFTLANVAMRTGRNDEAIRILESRPLSSEYYPFHYLDFMLGTAKQQRLDEDAEIYFKRYIENFNGRHFIKETYRKLAWQGLIFKDKSHYKKNMKQCKSLGYATVGGDKSALKEANDGIVPNRDLLKARLLFDGGYYQKAYELLKPKSVKDFETKQHKLEFTYRLARILHNLKRYNESVRFYEKTIDSGREEPFYYACNSALQLGKMFETLNQKEAARKYFKMCTRIFPDEHNLPCYFQNSYLKLK